ncbi:hypothetical protein C4572_01230 [Candidatus Parcubacteria bacterium]|nr:MAG: hypothetical protein C4572_01230 [Candidatus Parcubacteria bacterium]
MHPLIAAHVENKKFHHAYLFCGDFEVCKKTAFKLAEEIFGSENTELERKRKDGNFAVKLEANPDFFYGEFDLFSINDSHYLINWAATKPFSGGKKVFAAAVSAFNGESSNALLKTFEEANEGVHFIFMVSNVEMLIPALRSRLSIIELIGKEENGEIKELCEKFMRSLPSKRTTDIVKKLTAEKTEKQTIIDFLNGLELFSQDRLDDGNDKEKAVKALSELARCRKYVFDRAASHKIILEHLALVLPKF